MAAQREDNEDDDELRDVKSLECGWPQCSLEASYSVKLSFCSGCLVTVYCCRDHQKKDYKDHKCSCLVMQQFSSNKNECSEFLRQSVLAFALQGRGNTKLLLLTVERGADVNFVPADGSLIPKVLSAQPFSPLLIAAGNPIIRLKLIETLLLLGAQVNLVSGDHNGTPLLAAAVTGRADIAKVLIGNGADVNAQLYNGGTPIMVASMHGHVDFLKLLLRRGGNVDAVNWNSVTSLSRACRDGQWPIVKILVDAGADVSIRNVNDMDALLMACDSTHPESVKIIEYLLTHTAVDVTLKSNQGINAWMMNVKTEKDHQVKARIGRLLLDTGRVDANQVMVNGETALMVAAYTNNIDLVEELLKMPTIDVLLHTGDRMDAYMHAMIVRLSATSMTPLERKTNLAIVNKLLVAKVIMENPSWVNPLPHPWFDRPRHLWSPDDQN